MMKRSQAQLCRSLGALCYYWCLAIIITITLFPPSGVQALPRWLPGLAHRPDVSAPPLSAIDLEQEHYYNEQHHRSAWQVVLLTPLPQLVASLRAQDVLACMYVLVCLMLLGKAYQHRQWQKISAIPILQAFQVEW